MSALLSRQEAIDFVAREMEEDLKHAEERAEQGGSRLDNKDGQHRMMRLGTLHESTMMSRNERNMSKESRNASPLPRAQGANKVASTQGVIVGK